MRFFAVLSCVALCASVSAQASFRNLGSNVKPFGVSGDGKVVVGVRVGQGAFRWTQTGGFLSLLDFFRARDSVAMDANMTGSTIVGGARSLAGMRAARWVNSSVPTSLGLHPGSESNIATGINATGRFIVGNIRWPNNAGAGFTWTTAGFRVVPSSTELFSVDKQGRAVGHYGSSPILVDQSHNITQLPLGGPARRINEEGSIIGCESAGIYRDLNFTLLPINGVMGMSENGTVIATSQYSEAALWTPSRGTRTLSSILNSLGLQVSLPLTAITDISSDGRTIVGFSVVGMTGWMVSLPAPVISELRITPDAIRGGTGLIGRVVMNGVVNDDGCVVALQSSKPEVLSVPSSVTVPRGYFEATFESIAAVVTSTHFVVVRATHAGVTKTASVTITKDVPLVGLTASTSQISSGESSQGEVTFATTVSTNHNVALRSSSAALIVPSTVTVTATNDRASFQISSGPVSANTVVTISATRAGVTRTKVITVLRPRITFFEIVPSVVRGGQSAVATVRLSGPPSAPGLTIDLFCPVPELVAIPATLHFSAGTHTRTFNVYTNTTTQYYDFSLRAILDGVHSTAPLRVNP